MKLAFFIPICFVLFAVGACRKGAGEGGSSVITGKVVATQTDVFGNIYTFNPAKEDVYIIYDDADFYGDKVETSFDGTYRFDYLRKGSYTVFAYSDCDTCIDNKLVSLVKVNVSKNNSTVTADIPIRKE